MYREGVQKGLMDVIFMNERQEVTEGAISNVIIERNGRFVTPPVTCGLLNGVYRRHLYRDAAEYSGTSYYYQ
jgi:para-aminobenzoate synthetase/4-amino-4-deoxychorismate lyase